MYILAPEIKKDLKAYCQKYKLGKVINRDWLAQAAPVPVEVEEVSEDTCQNIK